MKKQIFAIILVFALILSLTAACGRKDDTPSVTDIIDTGDINGDDNQNDPGVRPEDEMTPGSPDSPDNPDNPDNPDIPEDTDSTDDPDDTGDEIVTEPYHIPKYTIERTLYQELRYDDGVLLACNEYYQPVFIGDGENVRKMNEVFEKELIDISLDEFDYLTEMYETREGYVYSEANAGRVGGTSLLSEESYRKGQFISFVDSIRWDGLGAHGGYLMFGRTFDTMSGELLSIADIIAVPPADISEALYNEYIAYHAALGDGLDEMARGYEDGEYNDSYVISVKMQCGENAVFWLANDGVHIYFDQYTFYYAIGDSDLVIPYSRSDLLREPFALTGSPPQSPSQPAIPDAGAPIGVDIGNQAPDFTLSLLGGGAITLSQLRGKPVLINIFTTWCPPCQAELPDIQEIYERYGDRIHVIVISYGEDAKTVDYYFDAYNYTFPVAYDPGGSVFESVYDIEFIPQTWVIDVNGVIVEYLPGAGNVEIFTAAIDKAF